MSYTHKIATSRCPLQCLHCHGRHLARECKRPRSPANGGENNAARQEHFIRARRTPGSDGTPAGSQADCSTLAISASGPVGPSSEERDPLQPGHPEERPWERVCIIQRNAAVDDAEASLRLAITAVTADATHEISIADASRGLRSIHGVEEASFSIGPFYPKHFLVQCRMQETRDRLLAAPPILVAGTVLML